MGGGYFLENIEVIGVKCGVERFVMRGVACWFAAAFVLNCLVWEGQLCRCGLILLEVCRKTRISFLVWPNGSRLFA